MQQNVLLLYKKLGETPLDTITRYKQEINNTNDTLSFAGRLDPMAEGLLVILRNEENKKRKDYESLAKTYECSFLLGFSTDSYDLLGKITNIATTLPPVKTLKQRITEIVSSLPGKQTQEYPPYSSYHIKGKPLYYWERRGELDHTSLPTKEITIHEAKLIEFEEIHKVILEEEIYKRLSLVTGNFRQQEILDLWKKKLATVTLQTHLVTHMQITCSSGTYIRGLVQSIGEELKLPTVTLSIRRTTIGSYTLSDLSWYS